MEIELTSVALIVTLCATTPRRPQVHIFIYSNYNNLISEWQNYLRTQAGNTTTVNVVICTVDYLLRLQESIMDFYWHYSSKVS